MGEFSLIEMETKMNEDEKKRLTIEDPVTPDVLQAFEHIEAAKAQLALENLALDNRKIQLLAAAKKVDEQHHKLFQSILVDRGLAPNTQVDIDAKTGVIRLISRQAPQAPAEAPPTK